MSERINKSELARRLGISEAAVRKHGTFGGFPVDAVLRMHTVIDPMTAEG